MHPLFKKIFSIFLLLAFFQSVVSLAPQLVSARQITLTVTETGIAGGRPAKLTAVVSSDDGTQKLSGIGGHFYFENPQNGQTCTNSGTTNAQGEVSGTCTSPQAGQVTIAYEPFDSEKKTVQTTFATAPAESGQYKVDLSNTNITFTNRVSTGYGVNAILKDKVSDQVISNQDGIEYNWTVDDSSIVKITGQGNPKGNVQLEGHKPGTTNLKIAVRKSGQTIAENSTPVTITQTTTGSSNYTAPAASPTPTPTPSPTVSPTPSATPTVTPTPKPSTSPTPKASASVSPSVSPSPSESPSESATPVASSSPAPSASPKPTAQKGSSFRFPIEMFLVVVGILAGVGIPLGWYYLDEHPEAKAKLLKKVEEWKKKFKVKKMPHTPQE